MIGCLCVYLAIYSALIIKTYDIPDVYTEMEWSNICAKHTLAHTRTQKTYTIWGIFGWFGCSYVEIRANARSLLRIQQLMSTFYISIVCNTECIRSWSRCVFAIDAFNMQEQRKPNPFLVYVWFRVWYDGDGGQSVSHSFLSFLLYTLRQHLVLCSFQLSWLDPPKHTLPTLLSTLYLID